MDVVAEMALNKKTNKKQLETRNKEKKQRYASVVVNDAGDKDRHRASVND
ncbi:MAG TPA: hypothetical protein VMW72_21510 [Sedimentisphaerales bacterium]|nr:hypothetical protein [Sedimentisphaerales bacterium]